MQLPPKIKRPVLRLLPAFVALVYLSGLVMNDLVHPLVHQHISVTVHSVMDEQDPCHRAIYHGEREAHNQHAHLTSGFEKCCFCDVVFDHAHTGLSEQPEFNSDKPWVVAHYYTTIISSHFNAHLPARASPVLV